jgi:hypothetical protein
MMIDAMSSGNEGDGERDVKGGSECICSVICASRGHTPVCVKAPVPTKLIHIVAMNIASFPDNLCSIPVGDVH